MNASAPGWQRDPSGRHEYRYWDGSSWTDDVSDAGMTSVDPLTGPAMAGGQAGGDPTAVIDQTQAHPPTAPYGTPAAPGTGGHPPAGPDGYGPSGGYPGYGTGPVPSTRPPRSGPSTGLLVGLGVLAVALIAVIAIVLSGGDDGDGDETSSTDTTESTGTTEPDAPDTTDSTDTSLDLGGDLDLEDPEVRQAIIDVAADQLAESGFTQEQAECFAGAMIDGLGAERLAEIGESGGDMSSLTPEDMSSMIDAVTDCGITEFPTG
jgi:hypothetical protein